MRTPISLAVLAVMAGALASSCASDKGYQKSEDLADRIDDTVAAMDRYGASRTEAFASMSALQTEPAENLTAKFEVFSKSVDRVIASDESLRSSVAVMKATAHRRFQSWGEENLSYEDKQMRERSQSRRSDAADDFQDTVKDADEMLVESAGFVTYLSDLRRVISNDLSQNGIASAEKFSEKARDSNEDLDERSVSIRSSLVATSIAITSGALPR